MSLAAIADTIKLLATVGGILMIAYSGLMLAASQDHYARRKWVDVIQIVVFGLCAVYLAPLLGSMLSGGHYCG